MRLRNRYNAGSTVVLGAVGVGDRAASPCYRAADVDKERLAHLYSEYGAVVFRRARAVLRHEEDARDVMQEVFLKAMQKLPDDVDAQLPWLYRVTTNESLGMLRKRKVRRHVGLEEAPATAGGGEEDALTRAQAVRVLDRVDKRTAELAVYAYIDGMTTEEIARVSGISRKTVGKRLARFRDKARRILER